MDKLELLEKRITAVEKENAILLAAVASIITCLLKINFGNDKIHSLLERLFDAIKETIDKHNVTQVLINLQDNLMQYNKEGAVTGDTTKLSEDTSATKSE